MARRRHDDEDWDLGEGLDPEGPSAADLDRFGDEMRDCPGCGAGVYDQSPRCPSCGAYLGERERTLSPWVVVGVCGLIVLLLFVVL